MAPNYLSEKVNLFEPAVDKNLRPWHGRDKFMFACNLQQCKKQTMVSKIIIEWNNLPANLRMIDQIDIFKNSLKTHLFKIAFPQIDSFIT